MLHGSARDQLDERVLTSTSVTAAHETLHRLWHSCYYPFLKKDGRGGIVAEATGFYGHLALRAVSQLGSQFARLPRMQTPSLPQCLLGVQMQEALLRLGDIERYRDGGSAAAAHTLYASALLVPGVDDSRTHNHLAIAAVHRRDLGSAALHASLRYAGSSPRARHL